MSRSYKEFLTLGFSRISVFLMKDDVSALDDIANALNTTRAGAVRALIRHAEGHAHELVAPED